MSEKEPDVIVESGEEMKLLHERYLIAVNNSSRRRILEALRKGSLTTEELVIKTDLNREDLRWHLSVLESVRCVEKENGAGDIVYKLTQAGKVIDYIV